MKLFGVSLLVLILACSASAASLGDYQKRLDDARDMVDLKGTARSPEDLAGAVLGSLPKHETVDWPDGSVETDNTWLADSMEAFRTESEPSARSAILESVSDRLGAISESVTELQASAAGERGKDEDKQKLAEILRREEYQRPQEQSESLFQRWWREFREWLNKVFPRPDIKPGAASGLGSMKLGLQILIFLLVAGLVGFLVYRFAPQVVARFSFKRKKKGQDRVILGEHVAADESADSLFSEAERLAREGDLRGAIRKGYVAALCELADRNFVRLPRHKTNRDYLRDVRKNAGLFENMNSLTGSFERNWYGLRPSEKQDWEDFRTRYRETILAAKG